MTEINDLTMKETITITKTFGVNMSFNVIGWTLLAW